ncbi:MAG TPA: amidohydrolase family protein [Nitrososphaeraceae archaeon]|jgi:cytosine/adenosine deaminase-related metal-dependent hydrolase
MSLIIKNASALLGKNLGYVEKALLEISKVGIISEAHPAKYERKENHKVSNVIDAEGYLIIPGFINAHTHIGDSIGKDMAADRGLAAVHPVTGVKRKILEKSDPQHLCAMMRSAALTMMKNGITTFVDFREGGTDGVTILRNAIVDLPINCLILGRVEYYFNLERIERLDGNQRRIKENKLPDKVMKLAINLLEVCHGFGISGANENTDTSLMQYNKLVSRFLKSCDSKYNTKNLLLGIHAAESKSTVDFSLLRTGYSEVYRIVKNLKPNFMVHMTQATDRDISLAAKKNIGIIICPRSNGVLGCGIPRISQMIKSGCKVAIGTDNIMINSPDMFREMDYIWKVSRSNGINLDAKIVLKMATINAAEILGLNSGCIKAGRSADFIFLDKTSLDLYPIHDPYSAIVHRANQTSIKGVMISGKFIDGSYL